VYLTSNTEKIGAEYLLLLYFCTVNSRSFNIKKKRSMIRNPMGRYECRVVCRDVDVEDILLCSKVVPELIRGHREPHDRYIKDSPPMNIITSHSHFLSGSRMDGILESILEKMISGECSETPTQYHRIGNIALPLNPPNNPGTLYITFSRSFCSRVFDLFA
jgi:hypothetical protein